MGAYSAGIGGEDMNLPPYNYGLEHSGQVSGYLAQEKRNIYWKKVMGVFRIE